MQTQKLSFESLLTSLFGYLRKNQRSEKTITNYAWAYGKLKVFLDQHNIDYYDQQVEQQFLSSYMGSSSYASLPAGRKIFVCKVKGLTEFLRTGSIACGTKKQFLLFDGPIGESMLSFIQYRKATYQLTGTTIKDYNAHLHHLLIFLRKKNISSLEQFTPSIIFSYISDFDASKIPTVNRRLLILKNYLKYLHEHKYISADYSGSVPKGKSVLQPELPSTFTMEEIKMLLASIDRSSAIGKRDYAILLLATKLGIRSSDIRGLMLDHILWQQNMISFNQQKTGKRISLPLLPEVGNALVTYLQHGRPISNERYVFLQTRPPYQPFGRTTIASLLQAHLQKAGINCANRKQGPHALRHSFAGALLNNKAPIALISEALGHSNSNSTLNYLRIDVDTLRQCALDVPEVPSCFYLQKGGICHG